MSITAGQNARASDFINESEKDGTPSNDNGRVVKLEQVDGDDAKIAKVFLPEDVAYEPLNNVGVGRAVDSKTYLNGVLPWIDGAWNELEDEASHLFYRNGYLFHDNGSNAFAVTSFAGMGFNGISFNDSKIVIVEFLMRFLASPTENMYVGLFPSGVSAATIKSPANSARVAILNGATASCADGSTTATSSLGSPTLTNLNRYRIEYDPVATEARFYLNGALATTITTNLPTASSSDVVFAIGCTNATSPSDHDFELITQINYSLEL